MEQIYLYQGLEFQEGHWRSFTTVIIWLIDMTLVPQFQAII